MTTTEKFKKLIILTGPTCSDKTTNSFYLAKYFNSEIICADSMHVYDSFDIGTGKPSKDQQKEVKYHLIDIIKPYESYDAWRFMHDSRKIINDSEKSFFIISGGTQLYIDALLNGLTEGIGKNDSLRDQFKKRIDQYGLENLYNELNEIDQDCARKISRNDKNRIIRFLEIFYITKTKPSVFMSSSKKMGFKNIKYIKLSLDIPKKDLDSLIEERVYFMIDRGLLKEAERIISKYGDKIKPIQSIGYSEIAYYLQGKLSYEEAIGKIIVNTRRLAKRQLTWMRKDKEVYWCKDLNEIIEKSNEFYSS